MTSPSCICWLQNLTFHLIDTDALECEVDDTCGVSNSLQGLRRCPQLQLETLQNLHKLRKLQLKAAKIMISPPIVLNIKYLYIETSLKRFKHKRTKSSTICKEIANHNIYVAQSPPTI